MDKSYEAPKGRVTSTLVFFLLVVVLLYAAFVFAQGRLAKRELGRIEVEMADLTAEINQLKDEQIEELVVATDVKERVDAREVKWSKVIRKLSDLTPVGVFYRSYSGSETGAIQVSALADNYESVADAIRLLEASNDFDEVFAPSVALGSTSDGTQVLSFGLQMTYNE